MPEQIPLDDSTITESSTGGPRSYPEYVDHNNHAADAVENLQEVANRFRLTADAGMKELPLQPLQTWEKLSSAVATSNREIGEAAEQMKAASKDEFLPPEGRLARFREHQAKAQGLLDNWQKDAEALLQITSAEVRSAALPSVTEGREAFAREEVRTILDNTPASDQFRAMVKLARGADRDQAAIAIGPLGQAMLHKQFSDENERKKFADILTTTALDGSIAHGTPEQKAAAKAYREALPAMQKYHTTLVAYARHKLSQAERGQ